MVKKDIDKLKRTIEDGLEVYQDVVAAKETENKITLAEGGMFVIKHAGKAVRFVSAIPELGKEVADLDGEELDILVEEIAGHFSDNPEAIDAVADIATGAGYMNQGIQKLIELKKAK